MPKTTLLRKQVTQTGTIQPHAGGAAPEGYLVCDGTIVNIADYPKLYAIIGTSWGYGNNDGLTFHLPDLRGRFLRGVDDAAGRDPDAGARTMANAGGNTKDAVGSVQGDFTKMPNNPFSGTTGTPASGPSTTTRWVPSGGTFSVAEVNGNHSHNISVNGGGDLETAPINININYIIKL